MPYEMLTSLTSRLYLSWELFTQGILILVPGSFFQLPLPLLFSRVDERGLRLRGCMLNCMDLPMNLRAAEFLMALSRDWIRLLPLLGGCV